MVIHVAVIGESACPQHFINVAQEVGEELARRGALVICGGLGGVMEAVCRGAKSYGGATVGILPGNSRREANEYVDIAIATGMGEARNVIITTSADVVIAIGGRFGTLSEIALALAHGVPVVGLKTWSLVKNGVPDQSIHVVATPSEAVEKALALAQKGRNP